MKRFLILTLLTTMSLFSLLAQAQAPNLDWELELPDTFACTGNVNSATQLVSAEIDPNDGTVYTMETCTNDASQDTLVIRAISSVGALLWSKEVDYSLGTAATSGMDLKLDPAGRLVAVTQDLNQADTAKQILLMIDPDTGTTIHQIGPATVGFTVDTSGGAGNPYNLRIRVHNATTLDYFWGDGNSFENVRCDGSGLTDCSLVFELTGSQGAEFNHWNQNLADAYYTIDPNEGGGFPILRNRSVETGVSADSVSFTTGITPAMAATRSSTGSLLVAQYDSAAASDQFRFSEIDPDTLNYVRQDVIPGDPNINQAFTVTTSGHLDGSDDLFGCGWYTNGSERDSWVGKWNTTATPDQQWNITYSKTASTSGAQENVVFCKIGPSGELVVGGWYVPASDTSNFVSYIRRYSGAGTFYGDEYSAFDGFPGAATTTPVPTLDGGLGFANFCSAIGFNSDPGKFLCGLVIVVSGTLLMAAATRDLSQKAVLVISGTTGFGLMIFVTVVELWPPYTTVIMIVLVAAIVTFVIRKQFIGDPAGG